MYVIDKNASLSYLGAKVPLMSTTTLCCLTCPSNGHPHLLRMLNNTHLSIKLYHIHTYIHTYTMADSDPKTSKTSNLKTSKIALVPKPRRNRSRGGCTRCRTRRQKCDEQKPECNRCLESGESCSYTISLQWGGRSFKSSSFGSNSEIKKYGMWHLEETTTVPVRYSFVNIA